MKWRGGANSEAAPPVWTRRVERREHGESKYFNRKNLRETPLIYRREKKERDAKRKQTRRVTFWSQLSPNNHWKTTHVGFFFPIFIFFVSMIWAQIILCHLSFGVTPHKNIMHIFVRMFCYFFFASIKIHLFRSKLTLRNRVRFAN